MKSLSAGVLYHSSMKERVEEGSQLWLEWPENENSRGVWNEATPDVPED